MNKNKIKAILKLNDKQRYAYFIRKIADFEEVWGLYDENGWATLGMDNILVIPFWPEIDFCQLCAVNEWKNFKPKSISLYDFKDKWIIGMKENNQLANVFMTPNNQGYTISTESLLFDLEQELNQYK